MDIVTQGLLGAVLAQTAAKKHESKIAPVIGFLSGLLADADILIRSSSDSLLAIEYHRHFTHSLFFVPLGALIAALLLWPWVKKRLTFSRLYVFAILGYSLSGFLDACTSYGTHLFWPLIDERISFHIISIVDPVFSFTLLLACIYALRKQRTFYAYLGLSLAGVYLLSGWLQAQRAGSVIEDLANTRGHVEIQQLVVKPTFANQLLLRSIYKYNDHFYIDAVRVGLFSEARIYQGDRIKAFNPVSDLASLPGDSVLHQDINRFISFSDDYVAFHPSDRTILADIRYSNYPTGLEPLWGIAINLQQPGQHARFSVYRNMSRENRQRYYSMLLGQDVPTSENE